MPTATKLGRAMQAAIDNINIFSYREMLSAVARIGELAKDAECDINIRYRACCEALAQRASKAALDEDHAVDAMRQHLEQMRLRRQDLMDTLKRLERGRAAATGVPFPEHGWWAKDPYRNLVSLELDRVAKMSSEREGRSLVTAAYRKLLAECCKLGSWREALFIYQVRGRRV
jgi:hypothetical protein